MEESITCVCDDPSCPEEGLEGGDLGGHIEECCCAECHREIGKISPFLKWKK